MIETLFGFDTTSKHLQTDDANAPPLTARDLPDGSNAAAQTSEYEETANNGNVHNVENED
jgi:hypothetical protein